MQKAGITNPLQTVKDGKLAKDYLAGNEPFDDRQRHPLPGLVLLDLNLPYWSGFEVLEWIRQQPQLRRVPVVIFTSSNRPDDIARAYDAGANGYLVKPNALADLTEPGPGRARLLAPPQPVPRYAHGARCAGQVAIKHPTHEDSIPQMLLVSLLVALAGAAVIGCKSVDKPASASFASVRIQGHTPEQIRAATVVVFQQDGYTAVDVHHAEMVFEKHRQPLGPDCLRQLD